MSDKNSMYDEIITKIKSTKIENQDLKKYSNSEAILKKKIVELSKSNDLLRQEINNRQRTEQVLLATKVRLKRLLDSSPAVIYSRQPQGNYGLTFISESITQFGYKPADFLQEENMWKKYVHPEDLPKILTEIKSLNATKENICEYRFLKSNGYYCWIQDQRRMICDRSGNPVEIIGSWQNITERKNIEAALEAEKELAQTTLESIGEAVITTDNEGRIKYLNPVAEEITGWQTEEVKSIPVQNILNNDKQKTKKLGCLITQVLEKGMSMSRESYLVSKSGESFDINKSVAPIKNKNQEIIGTVVVFRDITEKLRLSAQLFWQANHDSLTGLMNRSYFEEKIKEALKHSQNKDKNVEYSLCYLDLDRFKIVNDTCGHEAGDELLRQLAIMLKHLVRPQDMIARLGGDEFGLLLKNCDLNSATIVAEKVRLAVEKFQFLWNNKSFHVGVSIGLVMIDSNTPLGENMLSLVDNACYMAKDKGRNTVYVCNLNDRRLLKQREQTEWTIKINKALKENRFCLSQQAIVEINSSHNYQEHKIKHHEILLRMIDDNGNIISPMAFMPSADRYGLMPRIDRWVIKSFFSYYQNYLKTHPDDGGFFSVNLSGATINDELFIDFVEQQFNFYNIPPHRICFEITETVAIANLSKASEIISNLKKMGCHIALDDFGSGMSSFGYLKNIPCDYIKIDGHFVNDIVNDTINEAMVDCINRMAKVMGIKTIAEYVENQEIMEKLACLGIDYAQGYGICEPQRLVMSKDE